MGLFRYYTSYHPDPPVICYIAMHGIDGTCSLHNFPMKKWCLMVLVHSERLIKLPEDVPFPRGDAPAASWFINPINYRYFYKPQLT
jgi:hypothetical protein